MTDYSALVKNLREKHMAYVATGNSKAGQIFADAADAISILVAENRKLAHELDVVKGYARSAIEWRKFMYKGDTL